MTLNRMTAIGNLGSDPEMRYTPNGNPVTTFSVAVNRVFNTQDGERHEETEWFRVVAWNQLAENCNQYLSKGQKVYVDGRLRTDRWEGRDGTPRTTIEIVAQNVVFMSRPNEGGGGMPREEEDPGGNFGGGGGGGGGPEDDLPF